MGIKYETFHYRGLYGYVYYSKEDKVFYGKVEDIKPLISFEGADINRAEEDFMDAIDSYVDSLLYELATMVGAGCEENKMPDGYLECDGQTIESPFKLKYTYEVSEWSSDGKTFFIIFYEDKDPILESVQTYNSEEAATEEARKFVNMLNELNCGGK